MKPLLKRVVPKPVLQFGKQYLTKRITREISHIKTTPYCEDAFPPGINLIGPVDSATGLGQSFRLIERVIRDVNIPYLIYNSAPNAPNKIDSSCYKDRISSDLKYSINLWHINLSEFAQTYAAMGKGAFDQHYNIAFWLWELEDFPDEWVPFINLLDEIWTPSEFISKSIRKKTNKPVYTIPYYVTAEIDKGKYDREYFGLPKEKFLFLMMYDSLSVRERKNPEGVIKAFKKAFSPEQENVGLVIKINSAGEKEIEWIRRQLQGYKNVFLINRNMEKIEVNSLVACADVLVSLHRAEGFGLVLAEAMLNHIPVIATNWSANTEFMNEEVACMVGYKLKELEKDILPYRKGNRWAEPDILEAAEYMKKLFEDRMFYQDISKRGKAYLCSMLGNARIKKIIERRLVNLL